MFRLVILSLITLFTTHSVIAQNRVSDFTIDYDVEYTGSDSDKADMMGKTTMHFAFKNQKSMALTENSILNRKVIMDNENKMGLMLISMMDGSFKWAIPINGDDFETTSKEANNLDVKIEYLEGSKKIAGYKCSKARITGNNQVEEVWFTKKLKPLTNGSEGSAKYGNLDGFPLATNSISGKGMISLTATQVTKKEAAEDLFSLVIPKGYEMKTLDEVNSSDE